MAPQSFVKGFAEAGNFFIDFQNNTTFQRFPSCRSTICVHPQDMVMLQDTYCIQKAMRSVKNMT
jgi:hypothetical protein